MATYQNLQPIAARVGAEYSGDLNTDASRIMKQVSREDHAFNLSTGKTYYRKGVSRGALLSSSDAHVSGAAVSNLTLHTYTGPVANMTNTLAYVENNAPANKRFIDVCLWDVDSTTDNLRPIVYQKRYHLGDPDLVIAAAYPITPGDQPVPKLYSMKIYTDGNYIKYEVDLSQYTAGFRYMNDIMYTLDGYSANRLLFIAPRYVMLYHYSANSSNLSLSSTGTFSDGIWNHTQKAGTGQKSLYSAYIAIVQEDGGADLMNPMGIAANSSDSVSYAALNISPGVTGTYGRVTFDWSLPIYGDIMLAVENVADYLI